MVDVRVPKIAMQNSTVRLECNYDLEGEQLEVLRWYRGDEHKNEHLIYCYKPNEVPQKQSFPSYGIHIDVNVNNQATSSTKCNKT